MLVLEEFPDVSGLFFGYLVFFVDLDIDSFFYQRISFENKTIKTNPHHSLCISNGYGSDIGFCRGGFSKPSIYLSLVFILSIG